MIFQSWMVGFEGMRGGGVSAEKPSANGNN